MKQCVNQLVRKRKWIEEQYVWNKTTLFGQNINSSILRWTWEALVQFTWKVHTIWKVMWMQLQFSEINVIIYSLNVFPVSYGFLLAWVHFVIKKILNFSFIHRLQIHGLNLRMGKPNKKGVQIDWYKEAYFFHFQLLWYIMFIILGNQFRKRT